MRGWQVTELGAPDDVLTWREDLPEPTPGPGETVVRVLAAACNFPDILVCRGKYQEQPALPFTPGIEVAGEVVAVGEGSRYAVGDRVIGFPPVGGYAEQVVLADRFAFDWPEGMPAAQAAGMVITYQTGWCALEHRAKLQAGETLLVNAAAGGVGSAAVQLGKALGARVIGTAGGPEKCAVAARLGCDDVIDYIDTDLVAAVKDLTGGRGADVIYDPVGGDVFDASRRVAAFEGRILVIGFTSGRIPSAPANHVLMKNYSVVGVHWGYYRTMNPALLPVWQEALAGLWAKGLIDPMVGVELPLSQAREGLRRLGSRATVGKVVLVP